MVALKVCVCHRYVAGDLEETIAQRFARQYVSRDEGKVANLGRTCLVQAVAAVAEKGSCSGDRLHRVGSIIMRGRRNSK